MPRALAASVIQFVLFAAVGTLVALPSLQYPWNTDDLHLIRPFSAQELTLVWHDTWDIDGREAVGYRPLTVLFNDGRARLFGETVAAHRLFLIGLFAAYLVLVGLVARRFGVTARTMALAGVLVLCAKYSVYHFVWISDGVHLAQGVLFAVAALAILRWVEAGTRRWLGASVLAFLLSVLTREDSLGTLPVLIAMAAFHSLQLGQWRWQRRSLVGYAVMLAAIAVAALAARQATLTGPTAPPWMSLYEVVAHVVGVITLAGWQQRLWILVFAGVFLLALFAMRRLDRTPRRVAWMWLACAAFSCSPAIVQSRVNLMLFPITFYCLFLAHVAVAAGRTAAFGSWGQAVAVTAAIVCMIIPARESRLQQLSMASESTDHLETSCDVALGGEWSAITPPARRTQIIRELERLRMDRATCESLVKLRGRAADGMGLPAGVFVPPRGFLTR